MDILRPDPARHRRLRQLRSALLTGLALALAYACLILVAFGAAAWLVGPSFVSEDHGAVHAAPGRAPQTEAIDQPEECVRGLLPSYPCRELVSR